MSRTLRLLPVVLVLGVAVGIARPAPEPAASAPAFAAPSAASKGQTFTWKAVAPSDQAAVVDAIARSRPEARALVAAVAGLVRVRVGTAGPDAAGSTAPGASGYEVVLDLAMVSRLLGPRGVDRLVLHELGHVVDFALLDEATRAKLDATIPRGYGCEGGRLGACAGREERFAESFAKWATGDIGVDLYLGYAVPPPASLESFGRTLLAYSAGTN